MLFFLLILYQLKHFICDYPLQGQHMLGKFLQFPSYILPLTAHSLIHALTTAAIAFIIKPELVLPLAALDFFAHFIIDRIKASPDLLGRFKPLTKESYINATPEQKTSNKYFWWSLGFDQMMHHITHYVIIYLLIIG